MIDVEGPDRSIDSSAVTVTGPAAPAAEAPLWMVEPPESVMRFARTSTDPELPPALDCALIEESPAIDNDWVTSTTMPCAAGAPSFCKPTIEPCSVSVPPRITTLPPPAPAVVDAPSIATFLSSIAPRDSDASGIKSEGDNATWPAPATLASPTKPPGAVIDAPVRSRSPPVKVSEAPGWTLSVVGRTVIAAGGPRNPKALGGAEVRTLAPGFDASKRPFAPSAR